jgi:diguanylate cyclase
MQLKPRLTQGDWTQIAFWTLVITLVGVFVSLAGTHVLLSAFSAGMDLPGAIVSATLPIVLGGPISFILLLKNAQLRDAYRRLKAAASRDSLTACLNHGTFVSETKAFLGGTTSEDTKGALLVVDADYFKSVNDRFGHHIGDAALRQIASRIKGAVRKGDLVGRLGGEEFGVLLPGATRTMAETIAESIRRSVQTIEFEVEGNRFSLSVSIGGAVFEYAVDYSELFRHADKQLYQVKNAGRNSVDLMHVAFPPVQDPVILQAG